MKRRNHGLDEREMELVKLLMADCQSTGDVQAKLKKLFAGTIEQKIMSMYAKGMSQRDIEDTLREIYGSDISQGMISKITDRILPEVNEWQNEPPPNFV